MRIILSSWGWKKPCWSVCHMCVQRRFSNLMGGLGCSWGTAPGVHTHTVHYRALFCGNSSLIPMPWDWRRWKVTGYQPQWVVFLGWLWWTGDWFVWCLQTHKFAVRADQKKPCSLFQSCWKKALIQVKFALTGWCSVHSLSLPVVFVKPRYALMWSWSIWAHDLLCCNCGEDKPKGSVFPSHKDSVATIQVGASMLVG